MILLGTSSYENPFVFDGVIRLTFRAACQAKGLLRDDDKLVRTFNENKDLEAELSLRDLFANALMSGGVSQPLEL